METRSNNSKKERDMDINSKELVWIMNKLMENDKYKKKQPLPTFNPDEVEFIFDLIFKKPKGLLFRYLVKEIINRGRYQYMPMFNASSLKKLDFFDNMLSLMTAKDAAIKAGYSPHTAKQQGYRILKEIRGHKRTS